MKTATSILLLLLTATFSFGQNTSFVVAENGLIVRESPDQNSERIGKLYYGTEVEILEETGIDSFLKYASSTQSQEIDLEVVDSLRNFLFGPPGAGGLDLVSLNIQRGRDHGLADYNSTREAYGLDRVESFADITSNEDVAANLESLYGDVDNIDLWVGLMAEDHTQNGSLGETATTIIADQFERLRDGDRFYYENTMSDREVRQIENTSLGDIIQRNTNIDSLQSNVFFFAPEVSGTVVAESVTSRPDGPQLAGPQQNGPRQRGPQRGGPRGGDNNNLVAAEGITVELMDSEGNVVKTTQTDARGNYVFDTISESGAYQVRIATSDNVNVSGSDTWDVAISNGDEDLSGIDFLVVV
jgi:hypothetical protein